MRVVQGAFPSVSPLSCDAAQPGQGCASSWETSSPPALRRSEGPAARLYPVRHERPIGLATEAVWPIGAGRVRSEMEAPPHSSGIGCSEGVSPQDPLGFQIWDVVGFSSGRLGVWSQDLLRFWLWDIVGFTSG